MPHDLLSGYRVGKPDGGPECEAFERELEAYYGVPYARVFNSCTSALHAAVVAIGGDDWIVPSYSMSASVAAALHAGRKIIFADLADGFSYDLWQSPVGERGITVLEDATAFILPHLFGHHAERLGWPLPVIHDCAQSPSLKPKIMPGTSDDVWCYSLNQWKVVSSGEGGYALTFSKEIADRLHAVRNHGECYRDDILGWNYRMTEPVAAIARREFRHLDVRLAERREWAADLRRGCDLPDDPGNVDWFLYPVRIQKNRDAFAARIPGARVGYHRPIYKLPYFAKRYPGVVCPNAEKIESELVVIDPMEYGL